MKYYRDDIKTVVDEFQKKNNPTDRYASFDYCYYYFRQSSPEYILNNMEKSCLVIGFYLASWGMLRGSSFLLNKSAKYYEPLIQYIASLDREIWNIDVDNYDDENIAIVCKIYNEIKSILIKNGNSDVILITKVMLGVLGIVPAFDTNFTEVFRLLFDGDCGFRSLNKNSLSCIRQFYEHNKNDIDLFSSKILVTDFLTGGETEIVYPKSKIIDMYGFTKGLPSKK